VRRGPGLSRALAGPGCSILHLCQAAAAVLVAIVGLHLRGYGPTLKSMRAPPRRRAQRPGLPNDRQRMSLIRAMHIVTRLTRGRLTCLPRSCALFLLLAWHGYDPRIRLGVRPGGPGVQAHAWVEIGGIPVGEPAQVRARFMPLGGRGGDAPSGVAAGLEPVPRRPAAVAGAKGARQPTRAHARSAHKPAAVARGPTDRSPDRQERPSPPGPTVRVTGTDGRDPQCRT